MKSNIYITSLHLCHGGIEKMIIALANALDEKGFQVEIICTYKLGQPAYVVRPNVRVRYLTSLKPNREEFLEATRKKNIYKIIQESLQAFKVLYMKRRTMIQAIKQIESGTIISTRHEHTRLLSRYRRSGVSTIAQMHHDHNFSPKLLSDIQKKYGKIDKLILLTERNCTEIKSVLKDYNSHTRCYTIPNFIEEHGVVGRLPRKKQVLAVGRLHGDKDYSCLLRIWANISSQHPDWFLKIIGTGVLENRLKDETERLSIIKSVIFTGALDHDAVLEEMGSSWCFVMTSLGESFGLVLVEAMSCGTPPIAFNVRVGPEAIIDDGIDGFLVMDRNETQFGCVLSSLMDNLEMRDEMGERARNKATTFFKETVIKQWLDILR